MSNTSLPVDIYRVDKIRSAFYNILVIFFLSHEIALTPSVKNFYKYRSVSFYTVMHNWLIILDKALRLNSLKLWVLYRCKAMSTIM